MNVHTHKYIKITSTETHISIKLFTYSYIFMKVKAKNELIVFGMLGYGNVVGVPHLCIVYCERVMFVYGSVVKVPCFYTVVWIRCHVYVWYE